ncbi:MAG: hemerythrin domain-containing protein [Thermodesulfobacteriota bacterium]|nr:hemerythrin domain-containing protein [Thermodesulfobacteriota bacterium]
MNVFQWDQSFETGIPDVDKQHRHLVTVTNRFGNLLAQDGVNPSDIEKLFEELVSYTQYHFDDEEKVARTAGVDKRHTSQHENEHKSFFRMLDYCIKKCFQLEPAPKRLSLNS